MQAFICLGVEEGKPLLGGEIIVEEWERVKTLLIQNDVEKRRGMGKKESFRRREVFLEEDKGEVKLGKNTLGLRRIMWP